MAKITDYYNMAEGSGIISADTSKVLSTVQSDWQSVFGASLSVDATTPQGRIIELQTAILKLCLTINCLTANQINPNYATGQYLDALASLSGVQRHGATNTQANATIFGTPGTVIPSGFIVATVAGDQFETRQDVTIESSGSVSNVQFFSVEAGAIPCAANTLTQIVSIVEGVESVNNPGSPVSNGKEKESDLALRKRFQDSHYVGTALEGALRSQLNAISEIVSYWLYDNGEGNTVYVNPDGTVVDADPQVGAVEVDAHSIILMVQGGDNQSIAQALHNVRSAGCGRTAAASPATVVTETVIDTNGAFPVSYSVIFNRPAEVPVYVGITVKKGAFTGTDGDLIDAIKAAIATAWTSGDIESVDKPQIGATISTYEIGAAVSAEIPEIMIQNVQIGLSADALSNAALTFTKAQMPTFDADNIEVTIS